MAETTSNTPDSKQDEALEPCRFCGKEAKGFWDGPYLHVSGPPDGLHFYSIVCNGCCSTASYESKERAVEKWNTPRASVAARDAQAAIDHWASMYRRVAADNTELVNRLAEATEDGDLISRKEAIRVAHDHDRRHSSGYRCYEGEVIAEKIAKLPARALDVGAAAKIVSRAITEAGFNNSPPPARSWEEGKGDIPATASSPAPAEPPPTPEQIVYNVAQRDPRFRKHLIEQLTAMGDEQDTGPLRTLQPLPPTGEQEK